MERIIDSPAPIPTSYFIDTQILNPDCENCMQLNGIVTSWIFTSVSSSTLAHLVKPDTTHQC